MSVRYLALCSLLFLSLAACAVNPGGQRLALKDTVWLPVIPTPAPHKVPVTAGPQMQDFCQISGVVCTTSGQASAH